MSDVLLIRTLSVISLVFQKYPISSKSHTLELDVVRGALTSHHCIRSTHTTAMVAQRPAAAGRRSRQRTIVPN